jgi:hypothetical protein
VSYLELARKILRERQSAERPQIAAPLPMPERVGPDTFRLSDGSVWRETITPTGWIMQRLSPAQRDQSYVSAFEAAMDKMRAEPMTEGCLKWLAEHNPPLHRLLTTSLPDKLQEVWDTPGDHRAAFEWVLDRIWDAHRAARKLYGERDAQGALKTTPSEMGPESTAL